MVKTIFRWFKDESLIKEAVAPWIVVILLMIAIAIVQNPQTNMVLLNLIGLILITRGTILALRPGIRGLLNPGESSRIIALRNRNATVIAFIWIMVGFSLLMSGLLFVLIEESITLWLFLPIVSIVAFIIINKGIGGLIIPNRR